MLTTVSYMHHMAGDRVDLDKDSVCVCLNYCHSKAAATNKESRTQSQSINTKIQEPCGTIISGDLLNICSDLGISHILSDLMLTYPWGDRPAFPLDECFTSMNVNQNSS